MMNWAKIIEPYKAELLADLDGLLRIPSVKNLDTASANAPLEQLFKKLWTIFWH